MQVPGIGGTRLAGGSPGIGVLEAEGLGAGLLSPIQHELADAAIRILDLAGLNGDTFDGYIEAQDEEDIGDIDNIDFFKERTFTESIYEVCDDIFTIGYDVALCDLFSIASVMGFDLMEHIKLKMQYNRTRERLHGKKY